MEREIGVKENCIITRSMFSQTPISIRIIKASRKESKRM
jgi:hypothetical protein